MLIQPVSSRIMVQSIKNEHSKHKIKIEIRQDLTSVIYKEELVPTNKSTYQQTL